MGGFSIGASFGRLALYRRANLGEGNVCGRSCITDGATGVNFERVRTFIIWRWMGGCRG